MGRDCTHPSRPDLVPSHLPVWWVPSPFPRRWSGRGVALTHLHFAPRYISITPLALHGLIWGDLYLLHWNVAVWWQYRKMCCRRVYICQYSNVGCEKVEVLFPRWRWTINIKFRPLCAQEKNPCFTVSMVMVELQRQVLDDLKKRKFPPARDRTTISRYKAWQCNMEDRIWCSCLRRWDRKVTVQIMRFVWTVIFFFFSRRYNPWWVFACFTILFHNFISLHFSLQFLTFIFFRSSSTWSSHLSLGLPTGLDEHGSHSVSF